MRKLSKTVAFLAAALTGCDSIDITETSYPDMAAAASRGGISSGWIPAWLPASSTKLLEIHNIDTNESALAFNIKNSGNWRPPIQCQAVLAAAVVPSRYRQPWWPDPVELNSSYAFYSCPSDVSPTSMFVGIHKGGARGVHWRVSAR